jgi:hypothetical protein
MTAVVMQPVSWVAKSSTPSAINALRKQREIGDKVRLVGIQTL